MGKSRQVAVAKYVKKHYDRIGVLLKSPGGGALKEVAKKRGQSVNAYIIQSVRERMRRDGDDYGAIPMPGDDGQ